MFSLGTCETERYKQCPYSVQTGCTAGDTEEDKEQHEGALKASGNAAPSGHFKAGTLAFSSDAATQTENPAALARAGWVQWPSHVGEGWTGDR